jgi:Na+/melibiose symporter-like transporter
VVGGIRIDGGESRPAPPGGWIFACSTKSGVGCDEQAGVEATAAVAVAVVVVVVVTATTAVRERERKDSKKNTHTQKKKSRWCAAVSRDARGVAVFNSQRS